MVAKITKKSLMPALLNKNNKKTRDTSEKYALAFLFSIISSEISLQAIYVRAHHIVSVIRGQATYLK